MLDPNILTDCPVDGKSFLRAWQLSLRSCSIRNSLGFFKFVMSKTETIDQWEIIHRLVNFHVNRALTKLDLAINKSNRSILDNLIE